MVSLDKQWQLTVLQVAKLEQQCRDLESPCDRCLVGGMLALLYLDDRCWVYILALHIVHIMYIAYSLQVWCIYGAMWLQSL